MDGKPPAYDDDDDDAVVVVINDEKTDTEQLPYPTSETSQTFRTILASPDDDSNLSVESVRQQQPELSFQHPKDKRLADLTILDQAFSNLPSIIRISDTEGRSQDAFFIRDTLDSLLFKADIDDENENFTKTIRLFNLNETCLFEIDCHAYHSESGDEDERCFELSHQERTIGSLAITKRDVETFIISNKLDDRNYFLNFISNLEVLISRQGYAMPMAKIHLELVNHPLAEKNKSPWISFAGSISFCDSNITTVEQCLVIGLSMAIMMVTKENYQEKSCATSLITWCCCIPMILVTILLVGFSNFIF